MVKLTDKYSQSIKTAIDSKNPMNQVETAKPGSFKPTLNPYNQQQNQQLKPLPKADFEPLNNFVKSLPKQAEYLTDSMMASGRQLGRTIVNVPSAITYAAEQKIPQKESVKVGYTDVAMPKESQYKPVGTPEVDTYKSVKASMESQYQYEYMPENTKKAYETVVDQILKQESVGKSFDEQRQLVADLYPDQNIPSFVARKLMNIDSKEKEYTLKLENARENLVNMAIKNADELRVIQEKYKDEPIIEGTKLFSEVMGSIIQMSPYMIASAAGGVGGVALSSIAGTGTMYTTVFTNAMATSLSEGATREQATEYAHVSAMIEAGTEMLSGGIPFAPKGLLSSGIQGKIDDAVKILVKDGTVRKFISKGVDVFGEGAEEALAEYLGSMAMTIYKEDERSEEELKADMVKSFMMGALTSATLQLGRVATVKMAEKFVAEKAVDIQNIPLADANKIMNKIALRSKVKDFDGLSYRLEEMPKGQNGYIINGDEIVLNKAQVEEDGLIESALPHEMVHALEKVKGYDKLANFAIQNKLQTLNMDLATLKEAYQEKFNEVHEQELANGNEGHVLEIATTEKMTREIVADFIKENVASRPVKDAQGNIKLDENGNVMTYRDYNALLKLASNHPNVMDKIKKTIRNMIRKGQIAEALEFDETTKAQYLTTQAYLESLDTYLGEVLNNADKGLFEDYGVIDEIVFNMDPKVLSKGSDKVLEIAKDYTHFSGKEVNPESLTREDAIELLKYSNENGLGFTSIETEDGIVNQPVDVAYSLDAKEEVESLQNVEVELSPLQKSIQEFKAKYDEKNRIASGLSEEDWNSFGRKQFEESSRLERERSIKEYDERLAEKKRKELERISNLVEVKEEDVLMSDEEIQEFIEKNEIRTTNDINDAIFIFGDGTMVSGDFYGGTRGADHQMLYYLNDQLKPVEGANQWANIHMNTNVVRLVPETKVALIMEGQNLTKTQLEEIENGGYTIEEYVQMPEKIMIPSTRNDVMKQYSLSAEQDGFFNKSKVRDKNGNLLKMYHGTPNGTFNKFKSGTYFTANKEYADVYQNTGASSISTNKVSDNPKTYEVYLNIEKPFDTRIPEIRKIFEEEYYLKYGMGSPLTERGLPDWLDGMDLQEFIEEKGYDFDGLILDEGATGGYGEDVVSRGFSYVVFNPNQVKNVDNLNPTSSDDIRYSVDNTLVNKLNINTIVPMIENSKQDAIDYINSISQSVDIDEAQKGNLTSYLDRLSNFVRDYNPNIRYDSMGNITMDQEESKYNLRDGNKLKVFYYPGNEYNQKAIAYGYIVGSTPVGMTSPQEVYVNLKKPLYDVEEGSMDYLNYELQKDIDKVIEHYNGYGNDLIIDTEGLTNLEIIKAIGDILGKDKIKDFYNSLKAVTGYDGIEIPSSKQLILFDKEQFGSVKQRASYSEEAIKEFKNITFKKSGNNYIVLTNDFEDNQRTQVLDYNDVIDMFGKDLARTILGNATTQTQTLDMVENIIQKPNTKIEKGAFSVNRDDHDNQLTKKQDDFFAKAEVRQPDGTLKVMYHGSPRIFDEFDYEQLGTNGLMEGTGFYFTDSSLQAGHYTQYGEGKLYEVYLNITKSANRETKSIKKEQIKNALTKINELDDGNLLSEFGDVEREGLENVLNKATTKIHQNMNDVEMIEEILYLSPLNVESALRTITETTGIDGIKARSVDGVVYVAFFPEQIKSINNPSPTEDRRIQYSIDVQAENGIQEAIDKYGLSDLDNGKYILSDGRVIGDGDRVKGSIIIEPEVNRAVVLENPTQAQKEQLLSYFNNALRRDSDHVYIELHDQYGNVSYEKYFVVSDFDKAIKKIDDFYNKSLSGEVDSKGRALTTQQSDFLQSTELRDVNGNLIPVYHGTPNEFTVFSKEQGLIFFTLEEKFAKDIGRLRASQQETKDVYVVEAYLNIKKMFDPSKQSDLDAFEAYLNDIYGDELNNKLFVNLDTGLDFYYQEFKEEVKYRSDNKTDNWDYLETKEILDFMKKNGYDGLKLYESGKENYAVLNPEQIKKVDNLAPTDSKDIRYSLEQEKIATRRYAENALRASNSKSTQSSLNKMIENGELEYVVVTDKKSIEKAIASIGNDVEGALNRFKAGMDSGKRMTKDDLVEAQLILKKLEKSRRVKDVVALIRDIAVLGTELGQQVQALSLIRRMTPEGKLLTLQRTLNRMKENYKREGKTVNIEIPMEFQEYFVEAQARIDELTEQRMEAQANNEELQRIEREIDSLLLSNVGEDVRTLSNELSELRALEREENRLKDLVEGLRNKASTLSNEDLDILQEDILILKEQIILKQGSLKEIKRKEAKLAQLETQLEQYTKGDGLYVDYNTELVQEQVNEYQSRIKEIEKQKRTYANLEQKLESLSGIDPNIVQEMKAKAKEVAKAEKLLNKLVAQNERFTSTENIDLKLDEVKKAIAQQLPVGVMDKLNAWRYMSMLGNLRTNVRNVLGNAFMMPMMFSRDVISSVMEQAIPQDQRTRAIFATKESKEFAKKDYEANLKEIVGANKYNMQTEIERERTIYKTKVLEWMRKKTFDMLEVGDDIFVEKHYVTQLAKFLTARGYDLNTITETQMEEARVFAIEEARKATFKDDSALATALNQLSRNKGNGKGLAKSLGSATGLIVESVMPFKKTPINILKRGVEYSPIGLVTGVVESLNNLRTGEFTTTELIDKVSAGLTGTGIALVGAWMYSMGFIEIGYDEDETKRVYGYKNSLGRQTYSIRVGDDSYSIDWIAPAIMPFILGATIQKVMENDSELSLMDAMYAGALDIFDPIFELSMLQGVTDTLRSFGGSGTELVGEAINTMAANYISQYIPTIVGQLARTIDPIQRSTQADATGPLSKFVETTARKIANKVPFAGAMFNAPVIDVKGQPISASENPFMRAFSNFVDPGRFKQANSVPEDTEIIRLYELTKDTNVLPRTAPKSFSAGGVTQRLGNDELSQFSTTMGELQYKLMGKFVSSLAYKRLTDDQRIEVLSGIYDHAYDEAKAEYLKGKDLDFDDSGYKKVKEAELKGVKVVDYLLAKKAYAKMSGKGTKENFQAYLDKNGMSSSLMEIIGGYTVNTEKITTKGLKKLN